MCSTPELRALNRRQQGEFLRPHWDTRYQFHLLQEELLERTKKVLSDAPIPYLRTQGKQMPPAPSLDYLMMMSQPREEGDSPSAEESCKDDEGQDSHPQGNAPVLPRVLSHMPLNRLAQARLTALSFALDMQGSASSLPRTVPDSLDRFHRNYAQLMGLQAPPDTHCSHPMLEHTGPDSPSMSPVRKRCKV